ncbi:hypothetical protein K435DRAFT_861184 [Dendrothele bispora CBS 962.96]|uniref:Hydrophobic surface binding protein n=1 Tax=Dendrothele bispora (strain CBS 962.96) TaxID=1314807 RepID=A0A4S8LW41_DENBC|nr:hypothetical protein K435DRAFT_861184 [Dendrothele bispora CBS 962.96]
MQFSTRTLIALFISAASATCVFGAAIASKRDVATLRNDVAVISSRINDLDGGLNAFSENPFYFPGAQDIHAGNVALANSFMKGADDIQSSGNPLNETGGTDILNSLQAIKAPFMSIMDSYITQRNEFAGVLYTNVIHQDLQNIESETNSFYSSLMSNVPGELKQETDSLRSDFENAINSAMSAYD